jgi:hypothetical protein
MHRTLLTLLAATAFTLLVAGCDESKNQTQSARLVAENRQLRQEVEATSSLLGTTSIVTVIAGGCLAICLYQLLRKLPQ